MLYESRPLACSLSNIRENIIYSALNLFFTQLRIGKMLIFMVEKADETIKNTHIENIFVVALPLVWGWHHLVCSRA